MRARAAYISSLGTTGILVSSALFMLTMVSALVAFRGWPGVTPGGGVQAVPLQSSHSSPLPPPHPGPPALPDPPSPQQTLPIPTSPPDPNSTVSTVNGLLGGPTPPGSELVIALLP